MSSRRDATISALAVGRPALVETAGEFSPVRHVARIFGTQGIENLQQRILGAALARGLLQEVFERQIQVAFERDATSLKSYSSEDGLCGQDVLERLEDCVGLVASTGASSTAPPVSSMTFSMIGPSVLHGPHHSAQRSTTIGTVIDRSITAVPNVASVTSVTSFSITACSRDRRGHKALLASPNMNSAVVGIDEANVSTWMSEHVNAIAPMTFELIAGGRSNLTYRVV